MAACDILDGYDDDVLASPIAEDINKPPESVSPMSAIPASIIETMLANNLITPKECEVLSPVPPGFDDRCRACARPIKWTSAVHCQGCKTAIYCSEECREKNRERHDHTHNPERVVQVVRAYEAVKSRLNRKKVKYDDTVYFHPLTGKPLTGMRRKKGTATTTTTTGPVKRGPASKKRGAADAFSGGMTSEEEGHLEVAHTEREKAQTATAQEMTEVVMTVEQNARALSAAAAEALAALPPITENTLTGGVDPHEAMMQFLRGTSPTDITALIDTIEDRIPEPAAGTPLRQHLERTLGTTRFAEAALDAAAAVSRIQTNAERAGTPMQDDEEVPNSPAQRVSRWRSFSDGAQAIWTRLGASCSGLGEILKQWGTVILNKTKEFKTKCAQWGRDVYAWLCRYVADTIGPMSYDTATTALGKACRSLIVRVLAGFTYGSELVLGLFRGTIAGIRNKIGLDLLDVVRPEDLEKLADEAKAGNYPKLAKVLEWLGRALSVFSGLKQIVFQNIFGAILRWVGGKEASDSIDSFKKDIPSALAHCQAYLNMCEHASDPSPDFAPAIVAAKEALHRAVSIINLKKGLYKDHLVYLKAQPTADFGAVMSEWKEAVSATHTAFALRAGENVGEADAVKMQTHFFSTRFFKWWADSDVLPFTIDHAAFFENHEVFAHLRDEMKKCQNGAVDRNAEVMETMTPAQIDATFTHVDRLMVPTVAAAQFKTMVWRGLSNMALAMSLGLMAADHVSKHGDPPSGPLSGPTPTPPSLGAAHVMSYAAKKIAGASVTTVKAFSNTLRQVTAFSMLVAFHHDKKVPARHFDNTQSSHTVYAAGPVPVEVVTGRPAPVPAAGMGSVPDFNAALTGHVAQHGLVGADIPARGAAPQFIDLVTPTLLNADARSSTKFAFAQWNADRTNPQHRPMSVAMDHLGASLEGMVYPRANETPTDAAARLVQRAIDSASVDSFISESGLTSETLAGTDSAPVTPATAAPPAATTAEGIAQGSRSFVKQFADNADVKSTTKSLFGTFRTPPQTPADVAAIAGGSPSAWGVSLSTITNVMAAIATAVGAFISTTAGILIMIGVALLLVAEFLVLLTKAMLSQGPIDWKKLSIQLLWILMRVISFIWPFGRLAALISSVGTWVITKVSEFLMSITVIEPLSMMYNMKFVAQASMRAVAAVIQKDNTATGYHPLYKVTTPIAARTPVPTPAPAPAPVPVVHTEQHAQEDVTTTVPTLVPLAVPMEIVGTPAAAGAAAPAAPPAIDLSALLPPPLISSR